MRRQDGRFGTLVEVVASGSMPEGTWTVGALDELARIAVEHRVAGSLAQALRDTGFRLPDRLATATAAATADHLRVMRTLARVAPALDRAGVGWAVVKGPVLAARWPGAATARSYQDLDLLVSPHQLREAVAVLQDVGFAHRNTNWTGFRTLGVGEVPLDDGEVVIDLHWHLAGLRRWRDTIHLPTAELLDRTVAVELAGTTVPTLADLDTLAHLCLHDALAGAQSLVELRDVHLVAGSVEPEPARDRLARAGLQRCAAVVLDRAERVFGPTGGGPEAARISGARGWLALNRGVDALWGRAHRGGWTPFPGSLARVGRASVADTGAALVRELATSLAPRVGRRTVTSPGGPLDWSVDAGGDPERERYFDDVVSGRFGC